MENNEIEVIEEKTGIEEVTDFTTDNPIYVQTKKELNDVGCGFCLAKWTQVTMHLHLGHTHSCHHPATHKIPLEELKVNPTALHNTEFKKKQRKDMLEGGRPPECDYCWNVEDNSDRFSDRILKSRSDWSYPHLQYIKKMNPQQNFNPKYVEVAFSNACNFKCSYCGPSFSSAWMEETNKFGGYPTLDNFNSIEYMTNEDKMPIPHREENPYVEAFWKWWPDMYRELHTFRITGGEPLLSKDTWKVMDYIINQKEPNKELCLSINSNLGVPDQLVDAFITRIQKIEEKDAVKEFTIFTSCDAWGSQAEYIRNGLEFNRFWDNVNKILTECSRVNLTFMSTYNALSVPSYMRLIDGIYQLKSEYGSSDRYWPSATFLDSSYLRFPEHQTVQVLPKMWSDTILKQAAHADYLGVPLFKSEYIGYSDVEVQKIKRIYDWMISVDDEEKLMKQRYNFGRFFREHDRRRNTNFKATYPELADFYESTLEIKL
jgi:organic radical activating enzyme